MTTRRSWTKEQVNIGLAQRAWSYYYVHSSLRDTATCYQPLFDLCSDDVVWLHEGPRDPRVPTYPGEIHGKQALIDMLTWEDGVVAELDLEDPIGRPPKFVGSGDRVVMLIEETYRIVKNDVTVHQHAAVVMDFHDGLIIQIRIIASLSDYIEAQLGVGWSTKSS